MHRTDLMDTSDSSHRFMVERYRAMTPEDRLRIMLGLIEMGWEMHRLAVERDARRKAGISDGRTSQ